MPEALRDSELTPQNPERKGWLILGAFLGITALGLAAGGGRTFELAFTPLAMLVGVYLLFRFERVYLIEVLILFSFAPFVRRVADFGMPIVAQSPILAAPILVTFLSVLRIGKFKVFDPKNVLFVLAALGIFYGAITGVLGNGVKAAAIPLLGWLSPLVIGIFCYVHEDSEQNLAKIFNKSMVVISAVVSVYGVLQFFAPFTWDTSWLADMQADGQLTSMGKPEAYGIRVFATLNNSQGAGSLFGFAVLVAGLERSRWRFPAMISMLVALALTSVRSAWVACAVAGLYLFIRAGAKAKVQMVVVGVILLLCAGATASTPFGQSFITRLSSFSSVKNDTSYRERELGRAAALKIVEREPFGLGIGYSNALVKKIHFEATDLGLTTMPIELGYFGTVLYGITLAYLVFGTLWRGLRRTGQTLQLAIGMLFITLLFANTNPLNNELGALFWIPAGLLFKFFLLEEPKEGRLALRALPKPVSVT